MMSFKTIIIDPRLEPKPSNKDENHAGKRVRNMLWKYAKMAEQGLPDDRKHVKSKVPVLGLKEKVLTNGNYGFFSTVILFA